MKNKLLIATTLMATTLVMSSCLNDLEPQGGMVSDKNEIVVDERFEYVEGELLVKFSPEVEAMLGNISRSGASRSGIPSVDEVLSLVDGYHIERVFPVDSRNETRTRNSGLHLWYIVKFNGEKASEVARKFSRLGEVENVSVNHTIKRAYNGESIPLSRKALSRAAVKSNAKWNDPLLGYQWNIINDGTLLVKDGVAKSAKDADVQVEKAWEKSCGNSDIIVAVLDEGVFHEHPDLKANMWINEDELLYDSNVPENNRVDNDDNGYTGDYYGYNFTDNTGSINWNRNGDTGHGSHVAGIIAAVNNNGEGVSSIAGGNNGVGGVKIMSCQVFSGVYGSTAIEIVRAIKYAADNGAVVLQCSWGYNSGAANPYIYGGGYTSEEQWAEGNPLQKEAMEYFIHNAGSPNGPIDGGITVWAAGNEYAPMSGFPGGAEMAVSVSAISADYTPSSYTNYKTGVTIAAPGGDQLYCWEYNQESLENGEVVMENAVGELGSILSTLPYQFAESGYGYMDGTSMACPHVSGVVALAASYIAQQRRIVKAEELQKLLHENVTELEPLWPESKMYYGLLDPGTGKKYSPMSMTLANYKNGMGGLVNATKLLNALDGVGEPMSFPNMLLDKGGKSVVVPARYWIDGEKMTYTVKIENTKVATHTIDGNKIIFEGVEVGSTKAMITPSGGESQNFTITVRRGAGNLGWM